jgi:hypothetical protein
MKDEALKLALAALEKISKTMYHIETPPVESLEEQMRRIAYKAITAIKQALAAPVQEPVAWMDEFGNVFPLGAQRGPKYLNEPMKPLYTTSPPCPTCEALARTVMLDQTSHDQFKPDWNTEAVLVEEMQRMAKRIEELEAMLERQTARIVDLQTHIENFDGEDR